MIDWYTVKLGLLEGSKNATEEEEGEGIGTMTPSGIKWRGAIFLTKSTGKLEFLNNMVAIFEAEIDPEGNFSKSWEWK